MKVIRKIKELRGQRARDKTVALVPTMGAFHEGHLDLMRRAKTLCDAVYVSLFVNPTQFAEGEDFGAYPRDEARDSALAESIEVDVLFAPSVEEVYRDRSAIVSVSGVSEKWEGDHRPGHFDGVATVVTKLFNIVSPNIAVFGLKDLQQCAVVRSLASSLDLPVQLEFVEAKRDVNGLALSSRNSYFSDEQRTQASRLYATLVACAAEIHSAPDRGSSALDSACETLEHHGFTVEYLACVNPATMMETNDAKTARRLICAAKFCGVRLIDNVPV